MTSKHMRSTRLHHQTGLQTNYQVFSVIASSTEVTGNTQCWREGTLRGNWD